MGAQSCYLGNKYSKMEDLIPRRTECTDAPHITALIKSSTAQLFGRVHVLDIMYVTNPYRITCC